MPPAGVGTGAGAAAGPGIARQAAGTPLRGSLAAGQGWVLRVGKGAWRGMRPVTPVTLVAVPFLPEGAHPSELWRQRMAAAGLWREGAQLQQAGISQPAARRLHSRHLAAKVLEKKGNRIAPQLREGEVDGWAGNAFAWQACLLQLRFHAIHTAAGALAAPQWHAIPQQQTPWQRPSACGQAGLALPCPHPNPSLPPPPAPHLEGRAAGPQWAHWTAQCSHPRAGGGPPGTAAPGA